MLTPYEGDDVAQCAIRITRAGDGLSAGLNIAPIEHHIGDTVHVVLQCTVVKVTHEPVKDTDVLKRVHTLATETGTIVAAELVAGVLDAQRRRLEDAAGVQRLPGVEDGDE